MVCAQTTDSLKCILLLLHLHVLTLFCNFCVNHAIVSTTYIVGIVTVTYNGLHRHVHVYTLYHHSLSTCLVFGNHSTKWAKWMRFRNYIYIWFVYLPGLEASLEMVLTSRMCFIWIGAWSLEITISMWSGLSLQ